MVIAWVVCHNVGMTPTSPLPTVDQAIANFEAAGALFKTALAAVQADSAQLAEDQATLTSVTAAYEQALVDLAAAAQAAESGT